MQLPELALRLRGERGSRRQSCLRMIIQRELFKNQLHVFGKFLDHLRRFTGRFGAIGTLKIGELDDGGTLAFSRSA